jgi:hypothetical protein
MTPEELAYAWRDALRRRDAAGFARLFAEDGLFVDVEHRTADLEDVLPLRGRAVIEEATRGWAASTADFEYDVLEVVADETRAAKRWRYSVEGVEVEGVTWLRCANGEIVEALALFDSYKLLRGTGRA